MFSVLIVCNGLRGFWYASDMEIFDASVYNYVYILAVAVITFLYWPEYLSRKTNGSVTCHEKNDNSYVLLVAMILFVGTRPVNGISFVDMGGYAETLNMFAGRHFEFRWDTDNKIFDNLILWYGCNSYDHTLFFVILATIYFGAMYWGLQRLFPDSTKLAFITYLAGFSTFSYAVNGMKAGMAASIFILALSFRDKKWICILLMLVSLGFHHSMVMPIAAAILAYFIKKPKYCYAIWGFCLLMCIFHITYFQGFFAGMSDDQGARYLTATQETTNAYIGFRPDFILYSAVPVIMGYYFELKGPYHLSRKYNFLIHFYIFTNAIWMLCMYASFNNRIAYLSWFVYPIVIIAPFLDKQNRSPLRYMQLGKAVRYHLYFTSFMTIVYYGLLGL